MKADETNLDSILAEFSDYSSDIPTDQSEEIAIDARHKSSAPPQKSEIPISSSSEQHNRSFSDPYDKKITANKEPGPNHRRHEVSRCLEPENRTDEEPKHKPQKALTKKQKRRRRNIVTMILVIFLIFTGAIGIYLTLTHETAEQVIKEEANLPERVEIAVEDHEANRLSMAKTESVSEN